MTMTSISTEDMNLRKASMGTWLGQNLIGVCSSKCIKRKMKTMSIDLLRGSGWKSNGTGDRGGSEIHVGYSSLLHFLRCKNINMFV